jgi:hypothetical protein
LTHPRIDGISLAAARVPLLFIGGLTMKKNEFSEIGSNLLIFGSVSLALAPFLLGDRLILVVTGLMKEGGVMIDQVSNYVSWLIS